MSGRLWPERLNLDDQPAGRPLMTFSPPTPTTPSTNEGRALVEDLGHTPNLQYTLLVVRCQLGSDRPSMI